MKYPLSWATAWLAALLHFHSLCCGGAVSLKRKQPQAGVVRQLRAALDSRTEELTQQKNIAHGLELEVRELQSELQAEKKALATESSKEQTLQQKLNRVRAVLDDGPIAKTGKRGDRGPPGAAPVASPAQPPVPVAAPMMAPMSDDDALLKPAPHNGQPLSQSIEVTVSAPPIQESLEALPNVPDSELEPLDEIPSPQPAPLSKPVPPTRQLTPQSAPSVETRQLTAQATPVAQQSATAMHSRQTTPQEPPPFFEAAALQSSSEIKAVPEKNAVKAVKAAKSKTTEAHTAKATSGAPHSAVPTHAKKVTTKAVPQQPKVNDDPMAVLNSYTAANDPPPPPPPKAVATKAPTKPKMEAKSARSIPALRGTEPATKPAAAVQVPRALPEAPPMSSPKESDASAAPTGGASDFDALEAQLHEEDRRIQDLDRENELDSKTDGSSMPASSSPLKTTASQPALEEAPMEDLLNVEAPATDANEAAAASPTAPSDASLGDTNLGLPQMDAADGALSDNQFLAQIAPGSKK